jgi:DNA-binding NtrC family response regulator
MSRSELVNNDSFDSLIARSAAMQEVFRLARRVAETDTHVLILGETGTGKGLLARAIHEHSPRRDKPFVSVNCAALSPTLLESELFGHEKGAFTGALERRKGRFELAEKGTLFLDEIGDLNLDLQTKLLHVVESRRFERVGGTQTLKADVRLISATNSSLADAVRANRFREDLYYRLNVVPITVPPLRERMEDIPVLAEHFLKNTGQRAGNDNLAMTPEAMESLSNYSWPGNVRELENTIERAVILAEGNVIENFVFEFHPQKPVLHLVGSGISIDRPLKDIVHEQTERIEKEYLSALLAYYQGSVSKTAEHAQIDRRTLFEKMREYGLRKEDFKERMKDEG